MNKMYITFWAIYLEACEHVCRPSKYIFDKIFWVFQFY